MEFILLTIGKTTQHYLAEGINDFEKRVSRYVSYRIEYLPDIKSAKTLTPEVLKEKEGNNILSFLMPGDLCVLLDEHGSEMRSIEFSQFIQKIMNSGRKRVVFVVGGPYGFSKEVYARSDLKISLSKMTFTHEMIRLFFSEQLYRAMTLLRNEPYHHE